jgi:predicted HAD superfamily Cof-like phosphohydrolase
MKKQLDSVSKFHQTFNVSEADEPTLIEEKEFILRHKLMTEETQEYLMACATDDLVEIADALGDQLYILCGTILKHGMQHKIEEVFDEIQRSNMSKLDEQGNPIFREDGKILKGVNYETPNIKKILDV